MYAVEDCRAMTSRRDEIVEAALIVARREGLAAMSMRSVAHEAGSSVMALYRHVPSKDALLDALVGRLLTEVELPNPAERWEERLRHLGGEVYDLAARYPTVVPLLLTRAYIAPSAVRVVEATRALLRDAGVPPDQLPRAERMISVFLLGYATSAANHAFWSDPTATGPPTNHHLPGGQPEQPPSDHWRTELDRDIADLAELLQHLARRAR